MRCIHSISAVVDDVSLARAWRSARRSRSTSSARWVAVIGPADLPRPPWPWPSFGLALASALAGVSTGLDRLGPLGAGAVRPVRRVLLVAPVGGDPVLGPPVHLVGAHLDLDGLAVEADHRGVQGLVEVELGRVDVVLEPALDRRPDGVDRAQGGPAVLLRLDDDPDAHQVVEVVELLAPDDHLLVDAPEVLRPPGHLGGHPRGGQPLPHGHQHPGQELVAQRGPAGHHLLDLGVALGVEGGEGQVLELPLDLLDAQPVGQRGVDVEGLLGGAALLPLGHDDERPHVVEAVGQLDDEHPPVVGHGHEHLAHGGGLLGLLGVELQAVELGDAVDDQGHGRAEVTLDDLRGHPGVLHGVVQQGGGHRLGVEAQVGDDAGHGDGVGDVGLARAPQLAGVGDGGRLRGPHDESRCRPPGCRRRNDVEHRGEQLGLRPGERRPRPGTSSDRCRWPPRRGRGWPAPSLQGTCRPRRTVRRWPVWTTETGRAAPVSAACPSPLPLPLRGAGAAGCPPAGSSPAEAPAAGRLPAVLLGRPVRGRRPRPWRWPGLRSSRDAGSDHARGRADPSADPTSLPPAAPAMAAATAGVSAGPRSPRASRRWRMVM